jgi:NAD(P)H-dependent FMN reductase
VVFCTPEYVFGPPGVLKNALDWMVSTTVFLGKPAVLVVASTVGQKTFDSLLFTLRTLGCDLPDERALLIPGVNAKVNKTTGVDDAGTLAELQALVENLEERLTNRSGS